MRANQSITRFFMVTLGGRFLRAGQCESFFKNPIFDKTTPSWIFKD